MQSLEPDWPSFLAMATLVTFFLLIGVIVALGKVFQAAICIANGFLALYIAFGLGKPVDGALQSFPTFFFWPRTKEQERQAEERERQKEREKEEKEAQLLRDKEQQAIEKERNAILADDPGVRLRVDASLETLLPKFIQGLRQYLEDAKVHEAATLFKFDVYFERMESTLDALGIALVAFLNALPKTADALFTVPLPDAELAQLMCVFTSEVRFLIVPNSTWSSRINAKYGDFGKKLELDLIDRNLVPYLQGRFIRSDFNIPYPFNIPRERWFEATWIVANQGRGKTNLMLHLLLNVPEPDATIIVLDPKNDIVNTVKHLKRFKDRLVILEADKDYPLALNPLRIGNGSDFLEYIFTALIDSAMTENQSTLLKRVVTLARCVPNATIDTVYQILVRGPGQFKEYVATLKPRERDFFELHWDNRLYKDRRVEVVGRLENLYNNEFIDAILQSTTMQIDMTALMDSGSVICIDNSYNPKKLGLKGAEFFGRLFVALIWAAAIERSDRPVHKKKPVYVFIDEAHLLIGKDPVVADIIQQCRAQRIAMIFAHQEFHRITDSKVRNALKGCAIKFGNSVSEASELAPYFGTDEEFFRTNKALGQFCTYVFEAADPPVSIHCKKVDLVHEPKLTDAEYATVLHRSRDAYCQKPKDDPKPDAGAQRRDGGPRPPPPGAGPIIDDVDYSWDEKPKPEPEPDTPDMKRRAWLLSLTGPKKKSEPKKPNPPKGPRPDGREEI